MTARFIPWLVSKQFDLKQTLSVTLSGSEMLYVGAPRYLVLEVWAPKIGNDLEVVIYTGMEPRQDCMYRLGGVTLSSDSPRKIVIFQDTDSMAILTYLSMSVSTSNPQIVDLNARCIAKF